MGKLTPKPYGPRGPLWPGLSATFEVESLTLNFGNKPRLKFVVVGEALVGRMQEVAMASTKTVTRRPVATAWDPFRDFDDLFGQLTRWTNSVAWAPQADV